MRGDQTTVNGRAADGRNANLLRRRVRRIAFVAVGPSRASGSLAQYRKWQRTRGTGLVQQLTGQVHATAAARTGARAHGEFGHGVTARLGGLADVVIGNAVADTDVHVDGTGLAAGSATVAITLRMRMIVNHPTDPVQSGVRFRRPCRPARGAGAPDATGCDGATIPPGRDRAAAPPDHRRRGGRRGRGAGVHWRRRGA